MKQTEKLIACHGCDLLLEKTETPVGKKLFCPRCRSQLYHKKQNTISKVLAISISGLVVYIPAVFSPLLTLHKLGMEQEGSIFQAFLSFYHQQYYFVAVILFLTSIFFPLFKFSLLLSITLQLKFAVYSRSLPFLFRTANSLDEWGMPDVYLIAVLVSIIKISGFATIEYNRGFLCFIILVLMTRAAVSALDPEVFWNTIETMKKHAEGTDSNG